MNALVLVSGEKMRVYPFKKNAKNMNSRFEVDAYNSIKMLSDNGIEMLSESAGTKDLFCDQPIIFMYFFMDDR